MLVESKISQGVQQNADLRNRKKTLTSTNPVLVNPQKKDVFFGQNQPPSSNKAEDKKPKDKYATLNTALNAFALVAYTTLVGSALYVSLRKKPELKASETVDKLVKKGKGALDLAKDAKLGEKRPLGLRVADYFGELKANSEELTNNMVYGFGTLVIMPLVILFSPLGKKDATKEDRMFTVFRQPISFLTTFGAQLTVDKLINTSVADLNKYNLMKIKGKDGKILPTNVAKAKDNFKAAFDSHFEKLFGKDKKEQGIEEYKQSYMEKLKNEVAEISSKIKNGVSDKDRTDLERKRFNLNAEHQTLSEGTSLKDHLVDKVAATLDFDKLESLNKTFDKANLSELKQPVEEAVYTQRRAAATTRTAVVLINSAVSQAIALIALTFVYGKMMKGIGNYQKSLGDKAIKTHEQQKKSEEKGGVQ